MSGTSFGWPDVIIIAILALAAIKGFARGFISELGGIVAVILALAAAFYYNGFLDNGLEHAFKMNPGSAHVTGLILSGLIVYGVVMLVIWLLGRYVHLPVLGAGNALGGGVVGLAKGVVLIWVVLFVALLFPLSHDIRTDLHKSRLVAVLSQENQRVDDAIFNKLPDIAKPFVKPILDRQQV